MTQTETLLKLELILLVEVFEYLLRYFAVERFSKGSLDFDFLLRQFTFECRNWFLVEALIYGLLKDSLSLYNFQILLRLLFDILYL